ncbi:MAG: YihA family ribosome biogenesis GTP-binding protein [Deltaproteobacteria bacterium]|nr:YihA family ribosome biogenesis GTP-binding protein [Candidatus Anaeroferrophillus wilburensis]MBN2889289.1 YihA family ribosome biogenesis GTP-binding protein [Deltaproteobacteria bacterium]
MHIKTVEFFTSAVDLAGVPDDPLPQIAIAGRSNVGKSSLINSLLQRRALARTSARPGHTKMINFFLVNDLFYLVDLPGYGYAAVDMHTKASWGPLVHEYLDKAVHLRLVVLLLDIRRDLTEGDRQLVQWLAVNQLPMTLVLTKADKFKASRRALRVRQWRQELETLGVVSRPIIYSVPKRLGRETLLDALAAAVGPLPSVVEEV